MRILEWGLAGMIGFNCVDNYKFNSVNIAFYHCEEGCTNNKSE